MADGPTIVLTVAPAHRAAVVAETWNRSAARRSGQP